MFNCTSKSMRIIYIFTALLLLGGKGLCAQQSEDEPYGYNRKDSCEFMKGSYLSVSVNGGLSYLDYSLNALQEKGTNKKGPGLGINVDYSYFFSRHWGITTGAGFSVYQNNGKLKGSLAENTYYNLGMLTDNDWQPAPKDFEMRARITNLEEKQTTYLVEIPLMLSYQTYFNSDGSCWGLYGNIGGKLLLPVSSKFKIQKGNKSEFNVSGQYEGIPVDMGSPENPPVPQHGFGTITDPNNSLDWNAKSKLKTGVAASVELGAMFSLSENKDLLIGGYLDYGLIDMKKNKQQSLFTPPTVYHPGADNSIGNGITYNGMLNSNVTGKIRPISFGAKVALRFKL